MKKVEINPQDIIFMLKHYTKNILMNIDYGGQVLRKSYSSRKVVDWLEKVMCGNRYA